METTRIQSNNTEEINFLLLNSSGAAVTGLTGAQLNMLVVLRKSDGKYWDGDSWESTKTDLAVIERDATNSPGWYYYTTTTLPEDEYIITVNTANAANVPQIGEIKVGNYVDDIETIRTSVTAAAIATAVWQALEATYDGVSNSFGEFFAKMRKYIINRKSPKEGDTSRFVVYEDDGTISAEYEWKKADGTAFNPTSKDMPAEQNPV